MENTEMTIKEELNKKFNELIDTSAIQHLIKDTEPFEAALTNPNVKEILKTTKVSKEAWSQFVEDNHDYVAACAEFFENNKDLDDHPNRLEEQNKRLLAFLKERFD